MAHAVAWAAKQHQKRAPSKPSLESLVFPGAETQLPPRRWSSELAERKRTALGPALADTALSSPSDLK